MPDRRASITLLRVAVAVLLGIHGTARVFLGVPVFGRWLSEQGLPAGPAIAWAVTLFEIVGGLLLASGRAVVPVAAGFMVTLGTGIVMVHAPHGWWVVGAGRNGVEYSVLLLACLAALMLAERERRQASRA